MDINNLFNATTLVLCNYFLIAMGQQIVALDKLIISIFFISFFL
jgi:hypothetical protein